MKRMNIGIFAHVDAGKTTLTEQLLFSGGTIRSAGSVDSGTSVTDKLPVEKRRGISVRAACASVVFSDVKVNIIDTPGHVDFAGEVERSMSALDGAVLVVSAVEGIQAHTKIIWRALEKLSIPTLFVINKIDRAGSNAKEVLNAIRENMTSDIFALTSCEKEASAECEVHSIFEKKDSETTENLILALDDEIITEKYLDGEIENDEEIKEIFYEKCRRGEKYAVTFTAAKNGVGIEYTSDAIIKCLPDSSYLKSEKLSGTVFKIEHDKTMGKCAYIRLFGGELKNRDTVICSSEEKGKISQIRVCSGAKFTDSGVLEAGEIGAVYGLPNIKYADTIGEDLYNRKCSVAVPLMMTSVSSENPEEQMKLMNVLSELSSEDPLLNFDYNQSTREMYVSITGVIQLEILKELIFDRCGIKAVFSEPAVIFKEKPKKTAVGFESYTMPKPCWAKVELTLEPLPQGSGVRFKSEIKDKVIPYRYQHHVEQSVMRDCVKQGIFGWEVTDTLIRLTGGEYHSIHTHPLDFFVATPVAFLRALQNCETVLLEPIIKVEMSGGEEVLGSVIGDIIDMRGEFDSPLVENGEFFITALLPVQSSMNYPRRFSSLTSGKGTYFSEFYEYRECPRELYKTLPRRGVDPLDRSKWILYCRSALGES